MEVEHGLWEHGILLTGQKVDVDFENYFPNIVYRELGATRIPEFGKVKVRGEGQVIPFDMVLKKGLTEVKSNCKRWFEEMGAVCKIGFRD